jgi:hypothetical protein
MNDPISVSLRKKEAILFGEIRNNRVARWAAIAIALNLVALTDQFFAQLRSFKSVTLLVPAADVQPLLDPDTGKLVQYEVTNLAVERVAVWAQWPKFEQMYGALGVNVVLFAWVLRLALVEFKERSRNGQHEPGGRSRVRSSVPCWHERSDNDQQEHGGSAESPPDGSSPGDVVG